MARGTRADEATTSDPYITNEIANAAAADRFNGGLGGLETELPAQLGQIILQMEAELDARQVCNTPCFAVCVRR